MDYYSLHVCWKFLFQHKWRQCRFLTMTWKSMAFQNVHFCLVTKLQVYCSASYNFSEVTRRQSVSNSLYFDYLINSLLRITAMKHRDSSDWFPPKNGQFSSMETLQCTLSCKHWKHSSMLYICVQKWKCTYVHENKLERFSWTCQSKADVILQ